MKTLKFFALASLALLAACGGQERLKPDQAFTGIRNVYLQELDTAFKNVSDLQSLPELSFKVVKGGRYRMYYNVWLTSGDSAAGYKLAVSMPAGSNDVKSALVMRDSVTGQVINSWITTGAPLVMMAGNLPAARWDSFVVSGSVYLVPGSDGDVSFQLAQKAASNSAITLNSGSSVEVVQL